MLQNGLQRYFANAAGSTEIDLDFLAEEIAEPEEKLLAPPKEVQHSTVESVKPELDWSLFDFDTIDGPSFPVTSANATELLESQEITGAVSETALGDVKDEQRSLDDLPESGLLCVSSTSPSQTILPLAQDLHADTMSQSGMPLYSSTQGEEVDSTVHSDICSQDTTGNISDLESQIASSSFRLEGKPGSRLLKKVKKAVRTKKLFERYTVRKTPKKSAQNDKKAQQITPSKADTAATTSMVTTPAKERKNTPPKASKTPQVSSGAIGFSKKLPPMKPSRKGKTSNSVIAELRKAQASAKIDYKLPKDYDGFKWVTEVCSVP
ncbi:hypothetical protein RvY_10472 [Ramazzottius varieornatus]|uniref:Uncharacterized protein n=1 Tax=Ramazzottius varieornatus TaxID=947166 RepID=A0A1D1VHC4_RAMVA|nr:hypothetical protein RvY_10472 [Ramazzottius varieornatus]